MSDVERALTEIKRGAKELISEEGLVQKLKKGEPLRVKLGVDPTAPDIHLGHTVILDKLRTFQNLGHDVTFLIGDFTGRVGDPTGKKMTRPSLTRENILYNSETYKRQIFKILDPEKTRVVFNSGWLSELGTNGIMRLAASYTVARMLERDDFKNRYSKGQPISIHEFIYPLLQGYDSVAMETDIELGGIDQKFNLLIGRELQRVNGQVPQVALMMPLLIGLDGKKKMSKSEKNYISLTDKPSTMFGKVMSISDELMWSYYEVLSSRTLEEVKRLKSGVDNGLENPMEAKILLAKEIISRFHSERDADTAEKEFIDRFRKGITPEEIATFTFPAGFAITNILKETGLVHSTSHAKRMILQGAVKAGGKKVDNPKWVPETTTYVLQVGKRRFARVTLS